MTNFFGSIIVPLKITLEGVVYLIFSLGAAITLKSNTLNLFNKCESGNRLQPYK